MNCAYLGINCIVEALIAPVQAIIASLRNCYASIPLIIAPIQSAQIPLYPHQVQKKQASAVRLPVRISSLLHVVFLLETINTSTNIVKLLLTSVEWVRI